MSDPMKNTMDFLDEEKQKDDMLFFQGLNIEDVKVHIRDIYLDRDKKVGTQNNEASEFIVKYILNQYQVYTLRDDEKRELWIYYEGIYVPHGKSYIEEIIRKITDKAYKNSILVAVINKIHAETFIDKEEFFRVQDPFCIAVKNGILDLRNVILMPFDKNKRFFNKINASYYPGKDCPKIKEFMRQILEYDDDVKLVQEFIGFILVREYFMEKALMCDGNGRNGKGKLFEIIRRFVGKDNYCSISLQKIDADNYSCGEMHNKLVNIGGDISGDSLRETDLFRQLTGRDSVSAQRKYKTNLDFVNYAKMIFACNNLPKVNDNENDGFWARWLMLKFPYEFLTPAELAEKGGEDYKNYKYVRLRDNNIIEKIMTQDELDGLLVWAIEGLQRLLQKGEFTESASVQNVKLHWKRRSNPLKAFVDEFINEGDAGDKVIKSILYESFSTFCRENNLKRTVTNKKLVQYLENQFGCESCRDGQFQALNYITIINNSSSSCQDVRKKGGIIYWKPKKKIELPNGDEVKPDILTKNKIIDDFDKNKENDPKTPKEIEVKENYDIFSLRDLVEHVVIINDGLVTENVFSEVRKMRACSIDDVYTELEQLSFSGRVLFDGNKWRNA